VTDGVGEVVDPEELSARGPVRLHIVTGKGGTGKTTVAGALALALAAAGGDVLLVEVEGRQGIAQVFDTPPLPYAERRVAVSEHGGAVFALAIDPEEALLEYLELFYHLGRAGRGLRRTGLIEFATTVAPGIRDVLLTGKAYEAVRRRGTDGAHVFDAVVMDAPPTGRIARFLNVNAEVQSLARVGPVHTQAASMMRLFRSERTAVHLVTLLEDLPVQETVDGVRALRAVGLPIGCVVVDADPAVAAPGAAAALIGSGTRPVPDAARVATDLAAVGIGASDAVVADLLDLEAVRAVRAAQADAARETLAELGAPLVSLPRLPGGVDVGGLFDLADVLGDRLGALTGAVARPDADGDAGRPTDLSRTADAGRPADLSRTAHLSRTADAGRADDLSRPA